MNYPNGVVFGMYLWVNLCEHDVIYVGPNMERVTFPGIPKDKVARVEEEPSSRNENITILAEMEIWHPSKRLGLVNMQGPCLGVIFITSMMVREHPDNQFRHDIVSPGTGPRDNPIRAGGQVVAVTRFIGSL